ncbi:MAG: hypothetical protein QOI53_4079 [Verrucomicrobiota bacterium]|nr:hypothetical protein [Verrucomicrobiota bacterium]
MKATRTQSIIATVLVGAMVFVFTVARAGDADKTNIVFVFTDNLGYGELGCYGGGSCAGAQLPALTSSPPKACAC